MVHRARQLRPPHTGGQGARLRSGPAPARARLPVLSYVGNGKWQKVDGREFFKTAEHRAQVVSTQSNRLLEDRGIRVRHAEPDRKGRIHSEIEGSSVDARQF